MSSIELSPILIEASLRAGLVVALAGVVTWVLRRRSGALRHALWLVALAGVLLSPLASAFLPSIALPILPHRSTRESATTTVSSRPGILGDASGAASMEVSTSPRVEPRSGGPNADADSPAPWIAVWLIGCAWMLARALRSQRQVATLVQEATPLRDSKLVAHWRLALAASEAPAATECRISSRIEVPLSCGIVKPVVLLPGNAGEWSGADLRAVLAHELAHLRRRDPLMIALAQVVRAVHWFHPLVWWAVRELRAESERACDDAVIRGGEQPSRYAETLLSFAGGATPEPAAALAFLRPRGLEGRITGILEANRDRQPLGRGQFGWIGVIGLAAVLGLTLARPVEVKASRASAPRASATTDEGWVSESWLGRARTVEPSAARFRNRVESPVRIRYAEIRNVPGGHGRVGITMPDLALENRDPNRRVVALLLAFDLPTTRDRTWIDVSIPPTRSARLQLPERQWSAVVSEDEADQLMLHVDAVRFANGQSWTAPERRRASTALPSFEAPVSPEDGLAPEKETPTPPAWAPEAPAPRDFGTTPEPEWAPEARSPSTWEWPDTEWPDSEWPDSEWPPSESTPEPPWAPKASTAPWAPWSPAAQPGPWDPRPDPRPDARPNPRPDARPDPRPDARPDPRPDARPDPRPEAFARPDASGWIPARVRNPKNAPVVILEARTPRHAVVRGEKPLTWLPEVVIENHTAKRVVGLRLRYKAEPEGHGVSGYRVAIEPHGTGIVHRKNYEIYGRPQNMTVQILGVSFEDGSVWGTLDSTIDARDPWVYPLSPDGR